MGRTSKKYQAFDSLMGKLLTVPKSTIRERHTEYKRRAAFNPKKRGSKQGLPSLKRRPATRDSRVSCRWDGAG